MIICICHHIDLFFWSVFTLFFSLKINQAFAEKSFEMAIEMVKSEKFSHIKSVDDKICQNLQWILHHHEADHVHTGSLSSILFHFSSQKLHGSNKIDGTTVSKYSEGVIFGVSVRKCTSSQPDGFQSYF